MASYHMSGEALIWYRDSLQNNKVVTEVLVKWSGAAHEDNTWEILDKLRGLYPHLVGKMLYDGGIAMNRLRELGFRLSDENQGEKRVGRLMTFEDNIWKTEVFSRFKY